MPAFFCLQEGGITIAKGMKGKADKTRVNRGIKAKELRVIGADGEQLGVLPLSAALELAEEKGLDLVEVAANANPPVARIMDYGKYKYELTKKMKKNKKNAVQVKEIQFRPKTDEHDFQFKLKHIREFLEKGNRVKVGVFFRGREMAYQDKGREILARVLTELDDIAKVEKDIEHTGRLMFMVISPKK